jgi:hypothetical protein
MNTQQQTAMEELLHWVRKTLPMDLDWPRMIESKIESLIQKEQIQRIKDFQSGMQAEFNTLYEHSKPKEDS